MTLVTQGDQNVAFFDLNGRDRRPSGTIRTWTTICALNADGDCPGLMADSRSAHPTMGLPGPT